MYIDMFDRIRHKRLKDANFTIKQERMVKVTDEEGNDRLYTEDEFADNFENVPTGE